MRPVTEAVAEFASTLALESVPRPMRDRAALAIRDAVGVMLGASALPEAQALATYTQESGGRPEATAFGLTTRLPARAAAFHNAWLADLLDCEDTFKYGGNHPSATVIPAALAVGERVGASGGDLLTSVIVGYEVANRIAPVVYPGHQRGFLTTGTSGTLGAAAAAGRLLGLDSMRMAQALGIAGFLLPVSAADTLWEGGSTKPAHAAQAASVGVEAALLAQRGFSAAPLEGGLARRHGCLTMLSDGGDLSPVTAGLGEEFTLAACAFKLYPCCGFSHGAIDAAIELHDRSLDPQKIDIVTVRSYDRVVRAVGDRYTDRASSFTECQFSLPYAFAAALLDGQLGPAQFSADRRADPMVHTLARKVRVIEDPELTAQFPSRFPYHVQVVAGSETHDIVVDYPRGTPQRPLTEDELRAKFDGLAGSVLGADRARELDRRILGMEEEASLSWFGEHLVLQEAARAPAAV